jgi:PAS domain S-box-containing protein
VEVKASARQSAAVVERGAEARLELVELLLSLGDVGSCAEATLGWLRRHADLEHGICAVVEGEGQSLRAKAGLGIPAEEVESFTCDLTDRGHPLALALRGGNPVLYRPGAEQPVLHFPPLAGRSPWVVPLADEGEDALGLLLLAGPDLQGGQWPLVNWAARVLGTRLAALALRRLHLDSRRLKRELGWFSGIIEAVSDPILLTDAAGRMLIANSAAEALLSADDSMSEGRRRAVALNNMLFSASLLTAGDAEVGRRELLLVDPSDGRDLLFELFCKPLQTRRRETGTVSVLRNVTDLHAAAQELETNYWRLRAAEASTRAERDRLDLILTAALDPILVTDAAGKVVLTNPPAERLLTSDPEGRDREVQRRVRSNDAVLTSFLSKLYAGQERRLRGELQLTDPETGEVVPVEAISAKVLTRHGEDTAVVTILHDLSEAKEKAELYEQVKRHSEELERRVHEATAELAGQNELLRRQALELEQASAMKSLFLANVSHELRTPLNAIIGYNSLVVEGVCGPISERQREKLVRLDSNAHHLLAIINDLLDIARIEAGKMPVSREAFDLEELVQEVMAEVEPLIPSGKVEMIREVPADLPRLVSDRQKVKQIIINLLSNAFKFTSAGSVAIRARYVEARDTLEVVVADTGTGISEEHQTSIFEAFGQSSGSLHRKHKGTGLGLSICRNLAGLLGGRISLSSRLGEGSTFTLELPRGES